MADFNILFTPTSKAVIGSIPLDASLSESHDHSVRVTSNPIESGSPVNDHAFADPFNLSINGFITDSPVRFFSGIRSIVEGIDPGGIVGDAIFPEGLTRSVSAYRALRALKDARRPITVVTGLARYTSMVITSFRVNRDKSRGRALWFTMAFEQVSIVRSETVVLPAEQVAAAPAGDTGTPDQAASEVDVNKQATRAPTEQESTILAGIIDSLFGGGN